MRDSQFVNFAVEIAKGWRPIAGSSVIGQDAGLGQATLRAVHENRADTIFSQDDLNPMPSMGRHIVPPAASVEDNSCMWRDLLKVPRPLEFGKLYTVLGVIDCPFCIIVLMQPEAALWWL